MPLVVPLVPHVAVPPLVPLVGLLLLAAALTAALVVLRRRAAADGVPELAELPQPAAQPAPPAVPRASADLPPASYADLARRLAEVGDLEAAAASQWAADLEVLAPHLGGHRDDLAGRVGALAGDDPLALLRQAREAALALVGTAGPVRALLRPLDELTALAPADAPPRGRHVAPVPTTRGGLPLELWALLGERQRAAYDATAGASRRRSA